MWIVTFVGPARPPSHWTFFATAVLEGHQVEPVGKGAGQGWRWVSQGVSEHWCLSGFEGHQVRWALQRMAPHPGSHP